MSLHSVPFGTEAPGGPKVKEDGSHCPMFGRRKDMAGASDFHMFVVMQVCSHTHKINKV